MKYVFTKCSIMNDDWWIKPVIAFSKLVYFKSYINASIFIPVPFQPRRRRRRGVGVPCYARPAESSPWWGRRSGSCKSCARSSASPRSDAVSDYLHVWGFSHDSWQLLAKYSAIQITCSKVAWINPFSRNLWRFDLDSRMTRGKRGYWDGV